MFLTIYTIPIPSGPAQKQITDPVPPANSVEVGSVDPTSPTSFACRALLHEGSSGHCSSCQRDMSCIARVGSGSRFQSCADLSRVFVSLTNVV